MYILNEISQPEFTELNLKARKLVKELTSHITPITKAKLIPAGTDILNAESADSKLIIKIHEGSAAYKIGGKILYIIEEDDLIFTDKNFNIIGEELISEFAAVIDVFKISDFNDQEALNRYMQIRHKLMNCIIGSLLKSEVNLSPVFRNYSAGETIIEQGAKAGDVYTLVEGNAEAFVDGIKVGDISRDEVFGMMAGFTGTLRTATVKAVSHCTVLSVPNEKFIDLIITRPQSVLKLLEDMSRMIIGLNNKITG